MGVELQFCKMKRALETDGSGGRTIWTYLRAVKCALEVLICISSVECIYHSKNALLCPCSVCGSSSFHCL